MISDRIEDFLDRFSTAWVVGDLKSQFIEDASCVTAQGLWLHGCEEIERGLADQMPSLRYRLLNVRALGPAVRLVVTEGSGRRQTFTLILRAGRWVCAAFQDTAVYLTALRLASSPLALDEAAMRLI